MDKSCETCKHDGGQRINPSACTGCGLDEPKNWEPKEVMDIWKKAPEGAEYYQEFGDSFFKIEGGTDFIYSEKRRQWVYAGAGPEWILGQVNEGLMIKRPQAEQEEPKEWKDGLPLRDAKIEVYGGVYGSNEMRWKESVAYAIIDGRVLAESTSHSGEYVLYTAKEVRPIKSQAEKEREEFIDKLSNYISLRARDGAKQVCGEVYDWLIESGMAKRLADKWE